MSKESGYKKLADRLGRLGPALGIAAATALMPVPSQAADIALDDVRVTGAGRVEGRASFTPWSGIWWPFSSGELSKGWNDTGDDFTYDEAADRFTERDKPVDNRSPLRKYDEYVRRKYGTSPASALLELKGEGDFEHHIYGSKKKYYDEKGISYGWWGHCNGWAAASLMEREPVGPITAQTVKFDVADLKGMLTEVFWGVRSDFTGRRYNKPSDETEKSRTDGKELLRLLNANTPKPVADYIAWYEKAYGTTIDAAVRARLKPADFKGVLEGFEKWFVDNYDKAFEDLNPAVFHKIIVTCIKNKRIGVVFDTSADEQVWNFPAYSFDSDVTFKQNFTEAGVAKKRYQVHTLVRFASDGVSEAILGINIDTFEYDYELVTDADGRVLDGKWTGGSVDEHPDFAWVPVQNPTGPDTGENRKIEYGKVLEILASDHRVLDARKVEAKAFLANGSAVRSSERRPTDHSTTWAQPVDVAAQATLGAAVAAGTTIARVSYFEQPVDGGYGNPTARRDALVLLGESTTAPEYRASVRFTGNGKKMVVLYAYDAAGRLIEQDEITVNVTGAPQPPVTGDDAMEENDTKAQAKLIAAGEQKNLQCKDDDWFKVVLAGTSDLKVTTSFLHSEGDLDLDVQNESGSSIGSSTGTGNSEQVGKTGLAAGTYYVRVYGYNGAKAKYDLKVEVTAGAPPAAADDRLEENDTQQTAFLVSRNLYTRLVCKDDDWVKINLTTGQKVTFTITFTHANGDLDMKAFDAQGRELATSESTDDRETLTVTAAANGAICLKVYGYDGATNNYDLKVE